MAKSAETLLSFASTFNDNSSPNGTGFTSYNGDNAHPDLVRINP